MDFQDCFWGTKQDPLIGIHSLNDHFQKGLQELEQLITFLQDYAHAHDLFGSKLNDLSISKEVNEDSNIQHSLINVKQEMSFLSSQHLFFAQNLKSNLTELKIFLTEQKKLFKKDEIDQLNKKLSQFRHQADQNRLIYLEKSQTMNRSRLNTPVELEKSDSFIDIKEKHYSIHEINTFILQIQFSVPCQDIRQLFILYKQCQLGQDILDFLMQQHAFEQESALDLLNELLSRGVLKPIQRVHGFLVDQYYQWKEDSLAGETEIDKVNREYQKSEFDYKKSISLYESCRQELELLCLNWLFDIQMAETKRLELMKNSLFLFQTEQTKLLPSYLKMKENLQVTLETFHPEKELTLMMERNRTGTSRFKPLVFQSFQNEFEDQIFGVSLEYLNTNGVSEFVSIVLNKLNGGKMKMLRVYWNESLDPQAQQMVYQLKQSLQTSYSWREAMRSIDVRDLVHLFKLFLLELPISVCHEELYEPLKVLYLSKSEDFDILMRLNSIRSLISTMSMPFYETLSLLCQHFHRIYIENKLNDNELTKLSQSLGHFILRPETETHRTIHEKHPSRFLKDLILNYPDLFGQPVIELTTSIHSLTSLGTSPKKTEFSSMKDRSLNLGPNSGTSTTKSAAELTESSTSTTKSATDLTEGGTHLKQSNTTDTKESLAMLNTGTASLKLQRQNSSSPFDHNSPESDIEIYSSHDILS